MAINAKARSEKKAELRSAYYISEQHQRTTSANDISE
jgi:hypothetical protein